MKTRLVVDHWLVENNCSKGSLLRRCSDCQLSLKEEDKKNRCIIKVNNKEILGRLKGVVRRDQKWLIETPLVLQKRPNLQIESTESCIAESIFIEPLN